VRDDHAVNRAIGRDRDAIDNRVDWIAQKLEARDERNVELGAGKFPTKRGRVIEIYFALPAVDEWSSVEIFNATDA